MPPPATTADDLLAHEGFLRGLVRGLVHGEAAVDDVVQATFVVALERPPAEPRGLRGWLATVARNVVRQDRRSASRRARREAVAARPEGVPTREDILEREALRRRLVAAVLALDEPSRDAIVLRWFDGLPVREVAARLGVPVETAKTRLRRGLERLRARFDAEHGGDRRAWAGALAPLAGPAPAGGVGAGVVAAAAVLGLAAGVAVLSWRHLVPEGDARDAQVRSRESAPAGDAWLATTKAQDSAKDDIPAATASDPREARARGALRGIVVEPDGRTPVPGAAVRARAVAGTLPDGFGAAPPAGPAHDARADATGAFSFASLPLGAYEVTASGAAGTARLVATSSEGEGVVYVAKLAAAPAGALGVRVVSAAGEPVAGVRVARTATTGREPSVATTGADGVARFPGPEPEHAILTAEAGPLAARLARPARDAMRPRSRADEETLTLLPRGALAGRLLAPPGAATEGVRVEAWFLTSPALGFATTGVRHETVAGPEGAWEISGLPAGTYFVLVSGADALVLDLPERDGNGAPKDPALPRFEVRPGVTTPADVRLAPSGALAGRVLREDGTSVASARVETVLAVGDDRWERDGVPLWWLDGHRSDETRLPFGFHVLETDEDGRYAVRGLPPSERWRVRVVAAGLAFDLRSPVRVVAGGTTETTHRLAAAGTLEAVLDPKGSYALRREGVVVASFVAPLGAVGAVTVPGLAAGRWELCESHGTRLVSLAPFDVRAGETTWLSPPPGDFVHEVAFRRGGAPLAGVRTFTSGSELAFVPVTGDVRGFLHRSEPLPDEGPSFVVEGPEPDAVRLRVGAPPLEANGKQRWRGTVEMPSGSLRARCLDAAGAPAPGAALELRRGEGRTTKEERDPWWPTLRGLQPRRADSEGRASWSGVPEGRHRVRATFPDGTRAEAIVDVEGARPADVELRSYVPGRLRATVLDAAGAPARRVRVGVAAAGPAPADDPHATWRSPLVFPDDVLTDDAGTILVAGLPPGTVRVRAQVPVTGPHARGPASREEEVEIRAGGETLVSLRLEPPK